MKIILAQLNATVGDLKGNLAKVIHLWQKASRQRVDLVVFPELFLIGYPPRDLLERKWFLTQLEEALQHLVDLSPQYPGTGILLGTARPSGREAGKGLVNVASLIFEGQILLNQEKALLPSYDIFDETRHFDSALAIKTVTFKNKVLGVSICEDAWNDPDFWPEYQQYHFDPIATLVEQGADLLINISASPFHIGKEDLRFQMLQNHALKYGIPFIFVNQVGGNDELIFDGGSLAFDGQGELLTKSISFTESAAVVDLDQPGPSLAFLPGEYLAAVYQALLLGIKDYFAKCGFQKAVIGLSGGIDSALVAALATAALGRENVLGITMPSPYSSAGSVADSQQLAANLGISIQVIPISPIYESYLETLQPHFAGAAFNVAEENIQARIRGNIIMAFSNKYGYLALSTGNKSELAVGYCTLYGDMAGGLSVISDLPKTMVYELAQFINRKKELIPVSIIEKAPSAELRPDQKDQDSLPPYEILDQVLYYYIEEGYSIEAICAQGFDRQMVTWVAKTVDRNEYKRRQAAPGLRITSKAFGLGRRMPVAMKQEY